jgi:hypothetical protein
MKNITDREEITNHQSPNHQSKYLKETGWLPPTAPQARFIGNRAPCPHKPPHPKPFSFFNTD